MADNSILLQKIPSKIRDWNDFVDYYKKNKGQGQFTSHRVQNAIDKLIEYAYENFDARKKNTLLGGQGLSICLKNILKDGTIEHEKVSDFARLCVEYLFTDKEVFENFQTALGGKQSKEQERQEQERQEQERQEQRQYQRQYQQQRQHQQQSGQDKQQQEWQQEDRPQKKKKRAVFPKRFLWFMFIMAGIYFAINYKNIIPFFQQWEKNVSQQQTPTYTASNFTTYGNAVNDGNWIGNIDANSGFSFTVNSENQTTAKLSITYKSDNRGGILKVNGTVTNLYFSSTNWEWGTKDVIAQLQQGDNNIEFSSGWLTEYAPDIQKIKVEFGNYSSPYIAGVWKGSYEENGWNAGKGTLTLTINDDKSGVIETTVNRRGERIVAKYSVEVSENNGVYSTTGREFIGQVPRNYGYDNFSGNIINGEYKGKEHNFVFRKSGTEVILPTSNTKSHTWRYSFIQPVSAGDGFWYANSDYADNFWKEGKAPFGNGHSQANTRWTTSQIFIRTHFNISDVASIGNAYFSVWHEEDVQISLNGY